MPRSKTFAFFGAAPDTGNRGVSALFRCVMEGVGSALPDSKLLVFDNARGIREESTALASGVDYSFSRIGARGGIRYYLPENLATMAALSGLWGVLSADSIQSFECSINAMQFSMSQVATASATSTAVTDSGASSDPN